MNLQFDQKKAAGYRSPSQVARVLSEPWVQDNVPCPRCGGQLQLFAAGTKVRDLSCMDCSEPFQLKSQKAVIKASVLGAAYRPTIDSLRAGNHPSLLLLHYDPDDLRVRDLLAVPRSALTATVVQRRKKLGHAARRAVWEGCVFRLDRVPDRAKLWVVRDSNPQSQATIMESWRSLESLSTRSFSGRGWLFDVLKCIEALQPEFSLADVYVFEERLARNHPRNAHVRPKIRQQLQRLRNASVVEFMGRGRYRKAA